MEATYKIIRAYMFQICPQTEITYFYTTKYCFSQNGALACMICQLKEYTNTNMILIDNYYSNKKQK